MGHYIGSIANRVRLQDQYKCHFIIADLHMLTTKPGKEDVEAITLNAREMVLDYLSCGIDPKKSVIFLQSAIPETFELNLYFENLVTVGRLNRVPSLKDMARAANMDENEMPFGLLGYPILQTADILLPRAHLVPVGKDNESHVELTREVAKRFNFLYGDVFPIPEVLVGEVPTLVGTDGQAKMSKSLGNCINLSDDPKAVEKKVKGMFTDPNRIRPDIPGRVEGNPVFIYHDAFNPNKAQILDLKTRYLAGTVGDVEVKEKLAVALNNFLDPIREKRAFFEAQNGYVDEVIYQGIQIHRETARETIQEVRKAMGFSGVWNKINRKAEDYRKKQEKNPG